MKLFVKCTSVILTILCAAVLAFCAVLGDILPDSVTLYENENTAFEEYSLLGIDTVVINEDKNGSEKQAAFIFGAGASDSFDTSGEITLFHIIPVKAVAVHHENKYCVVPCGTLFGIKLRTKGAAVVKCCSVFDEQLGKTRDPAAQCGIRPGDTICAVNGIEIKTYHDAERLTEESGGETLTLSCLRGDEPFTAEIRPALSGGKYRLGLWIRDSASGLGTMTFYEPENGRFASLGHGVCDEETGELLSIEKAQITAVEIAGITKGADGSPGSINGYFSELPPIGLADRNTQNGLYGELSRAIHGQAPVEIAAVNEIVKGNAQILCTVDDREPQLYDIEISGIDYDVNNKTKNLEIIVCDERLKSKTGGIIQGMSGSPILQNGKLAGAVTHVLVTNSVKGYGIFAQNMFEELEKEQN